MIKTIKKAILISMILIPACVAEQNNVDEKTDIIENPGTFLPSIDHVVDIFELKYGEVKEYAYGQQTFRFFIEKIEDHTMDCSVAYFIGSYDEVRIHACLRMETGNDIYRIKVSGLPCGPHNYRGDAPTTIQYIKDELLESWANSIANQKDPSWFNYVFKRNFDKGTKVNALYSIYMGAAYTRVHHHQEGNKEIYKFIFILTKN